MLPGLGGRLWSLRDLEAERDLVFTNRRLQFANFALTDAWFAGGDRVEPRLHRPLGHDEPTCLRGQRAVQPWSRPADLGVGTHPRSCVLGRPADAGRPSVTARLRPRPQPRPRAQTALLVDEHRRSGSNRACGSWLPRLELGGPGTTDPSRASTSPSPTTRPPMSAIRCTAQRAADYFFQVPAERRPWIAAVQADGSGLIQTSTARLRGRKLFCWGTAAGGRHWQEWLCGPGSRYLEIQAGLATTQLEHLRLEGGAEISWAEAYAPIEAASGAVHGSWPDALAEVAELVARAVPEEELDEWHRWWRAEVADEAPQQLTAGSGAGEAELAVRGEDPDGLPGTPFGQPPLGRLPPSRRAGSHGRGRPGRRGCGRPGATDLRSAGVRCSTARRTAGGAD